MKATLKKLYTHPVVKAIIALIVAFLFCALGK